MRSVGRCLTLPPRLDDNPGTLTCTAECPCLPFKGEVADRPEGISGEPPRRQSVTNSGWLSYNFWAPRPVLLRQISQ